ncbi:class I SAM-dependent methyltransferase [Thermithiobacillus plumbiphilus]|uniref:Methyltransferase domain-containing protein n=1 Tax=Thermithiobacillus plumbiphilus TaxID=1729899 RepID=A0ABU9DAL6_9PROT
MAEVMTAKNLQFLHLGCGRIYFDGWLNIDLDSPVADLNLDLSQPLPLANGSVHYIYNEHFMEHLDLASGMRLLAECRRVLQPGGVLRIAMPDLDYLLDKYKGEWRDQDWLRWPEYQFVETRAQMLNMAMREWGHQYLYNREELELRLRQCGFTKIDFLSFGFSLHESLCNRETRPDSMLIAEAAHA